SFNSFPAFSPGAASCVASRSDASSSRESGTRTDIPLVRRRPSDVSSTVAGMPCSSSSFTQRCASACVSAKTTATYSPKTSGSSPRCLPKGFSDIITLLLLLRCKNPRQLHARRLHRQDVHLISICVMAALAWQPAQLLASDLPPAVLREGSSLRSS